MILHLRIVNPVVAEKALLDLGLYSEQIDPDGSPYIWDTPGCSIIPVENVVVTPAVFDANDVQVTPAVYAQQQHFNCVVGPRALWHYTEEVIDDISGETVTVNRTMPLAEHLSTFLEDAVAANKPAQSNKSETAWWYRSVEVVDMTTISVPPARVVL